tara:strand:+ start:764 stop:1150 length:387 start_codon:yes stop_codon:yes gene_type:complete
MNDYDNTNKGAVFAPFPEQKFILQGKVNVSGTDESLSLIMAENKDGKKRIEIYQKVGVLFENDKRGNDKAPDYSGPFTVDNIEKRIASWKKMKDDKAYMSLEISEKITASKELVPSTSLADEIGDIPF